MIARLTVALVLIFASGLLSAFSSSAYPQVSSGTIAGVVGDAAGRPIAEARVSLTNRDTGSIRNLTTSAEGAYSAVALPPGFYQVRAEATGFSLFERTALVETGTTTTVNPTLQVGEISEQVTVETAAPLMQYEQHQVGGPVSRNQIENLPVNGRNFLEFAKFEPGVQAPVRASSNRWFVPALGQPTGNPGRGTRVTVDGGSIMAVGTGGSAMGFSQEVVEEFQVATVNFELTTGLTNGAAINVTTRSGGNQIHGTGFYFFRDHKLAAYPALNRDAVNPDPFFQRRQFGFALSGPIQRNRFFFFGAYERNEQRGVVPTTLLIPEFTHFNRITSSPYFGNQLSVRLDGGLSKSHNVFLRYSHDGISTHGPTTTQTNAYPSSWTRQPGWTDNGVFGLTSVFTDTLVNDLRFSYLYVSSGQQAVTEQECQDCLGIGALAINVSEGGISVGQGLNQQTVGRRFHLNDYVTWQRTGHRLKFGVDWEYNRGGTLSSNNEPATLTLYSPQRARQAGIPLPTRFHTLEEILQLPLQNVTVGIGDLHVLQADGRKVRSWNTLRLFFQDTWRLSSKLNLNYGLSWNVDRNLNYDLAKPALLAPLLGADNLGPTRKQWKNFSPILGLAWSPNRDGKTVIRGGAGVFYDFMFQGFLDSERALFGPPASGRQNIAGNRLLNCLAGIPGVPIGTPLNFVNAPTRFTGANLLTCLPGIRAELEQSLATSDRTLQTIQLTKQAGNFNQEHVPTPRALHINVGVQRELMKDFVISADFAFRRFTHFGLTDRIGISQVDVNHFNSARGPVIPRCLNNAQRNDPHALCSTGPILVHQGAGRATYKGLLVRADKRFSHGFQLLASWAYSSNTGTNIGNGFDMDDWLSNRGPLDRDHTHIANLAGVVQLPCRFRMGVNFSYTSTPPFSAFVGGNDFNGDGTTDDLLPGTTVNTFNRNAGRSDLEQLVTQFNQTFAGKVDAKGAAIPQLVLPASYWFGDNFQSLDLRLSREFAFSDRWRLSIIGEVFNVYNAANLSGHSGNLNSSAFGQPTARFTQVFGSGGPRAFQLGARVNF